MFIAARGSQAGGLRHSALAYWTIVHRCSRLAGRRPAPHCVPTGRMFIAAPGSQAGGLRHTAFPLDECSSLLAPIQMSACSTLP